MNQPRLIDVEELFANPDFTSATLSPDGTRIAYVAPYKGRLNVWVRGIDEDHDDAICVTRDANHRLYRAIERHFATYLGSRVKEPAS